MPIPRSPALISSPALQDAQSRLIDKEAELAALRDRVLSQSPRRGPAALAAAAAAGAAAAAAAASNAGAWASSQQHGGQQQGVGGVAAGTGGDRRGAQGAGAAGGAGSSRAAAVSRLSPLRPPELTLPGPGMMLAQVRCAVACNGLFWEGGGPMID